MNDKIKVGVDLSKHYENKIKLALRDGTSVKIRLSKQNINPSSKNILVLTPIQYSKLNDGKTHEITISHSRLKSIAHGGFLPFLLPLLGGLASLAGIAGGVATAVKSSKEAQLADAQRAKTQGNGLKNKRKGGCLIYSRPTLLPYTPGILEEEATKRKFINFRGVIFKNEIEKLGKPLDTECGIIGSKNSNEDDMHWCAYIKNNSNKFYFDSFGLEPTEELKKSLKPKILISTFQLQDYNESNCGQWCLWFLSEMNKLLKENGKITQVDFIDLI